MKADAAVEQAVDVLKLGARDYLAKQFDGDRFRRVLVEVREAVERRLQMIAIKRQVAREDIPHLIAQFLRELAVGNPMAERELAGHLCSPPPRMSRIHAVQQRAVARRALPPAALDAREREHIVEVLRQVRGNRMAAARMLGISRRALYRRLDRYQIVDEVPRLAVGQRV